ncbi:MAG: hypothetical protein IPK21_20300 [Haliscomenobacter sp.]|nr:hypothetical protein [Haliscomenobacter sp.]
MISIPTHRTPSCGEGICSPFTLNWSTPEACHASGQTGLPWSRCKGNAGDALHHFGGIHVGESGDLLGRNNIFMLSAFSAPPKRGSDLPLSPGPVTSRAKGGREADIHFYDRIFAKSWLRI